MNELRDALARATAAVWGGKVGPGDRTEADAVLSTDEMQAIRSALRVAWDETRIGCPYLNQRGDEGAYGPNTCGGGCVDEPLCIMHSYPRLPEAVIDWVLAANLSAPDPATYKCDPRNDDPACGLPCRWCKWPHWAYDPVTKDSIYVGVEPQ